MCPAQPLPLSLPALGTGAQLRVQLLACFAQPAQPGAWANLAAPCVAQGHAQSAGAAAQVGFQHCHREGVDWVFVTHPSYVRPGVAQACISLRSVFSGTLLRCLMAALVCCWV